MIEPTITREYSDSTEYVYITPLFTVYVNRRIYVGEYEDKLSVSILPRRNDDGFTEDDVQSIVAALQEVGT